MGNPDDRHLTEEELESAAGFHNPTAGSFVQTDFPAESVAQHLSGCPGCQQQLDARVSANIRLSALKNQSAAESGNLCPDDEEWTTMAAGLGDENHVRRMLDHAATCDHCGPLLLHATEDFSNEVTADERYVLEVLKSGGSDWQRRLASRLGAVPKDQSQKTAGVASRWNRIFVLPRLAFAAGLLIVVTLTTWIGISLLRPPSPDLLLAEAYTERRTLEVRIAGAKHAPIRVQRGTGSSNLDQPTSLLKAEALIGDSLRKSPNDPRWLAARGRADLLDGNYESAINTLGRSLELQPNGSESLTDLASAYFERAEALDRPIDYGTAIELLSKVLVKSPQDSVALFNRALICERMFLYTQAVNDWENYLRVDPQGEWAEEARTRLDALKRKLREQATSQAQPLLSPLEIAAAKPKNADLSEEIDRRFEQYMDSAITDWLPRAFPDSTQQASNTDDLQSSLSLLADLAIQRHSDTWLSTLLSFSSSPGFAPAVAHLARAVQADNDGDNVNARLNAAEAKRLFAQTGNDAGALRADLEYLFASHDAQESKPCLNAANGLEQKLKTQSYAWLRTEFHIEQGTCYWLLGNLGESRQLYALAADEATAAGYPEIYLRTQDHLSGITGEAGNLTESWSRTREALARFWSGHYRPMRAYNLYYNLYEFSRQSRQPNLQVVVWRDGIRLSDFFTDNVLRAMAHSAMSNAARSAGDQRLAEEEIAIASKFFDASPQIKSTRINRMESDTRLAEIEAIQGQPQVAISRLHSLAPEISQLSDDYLAILYFTTLANAESQIGYGSDAESALTSAVRFSEFHLRSLRSEKSQIEWTQRTTSTYRTFVQLKLQQGDALRALEIWEWYLGSSLRAGASTSRSPSSPASLPTEPREVSILLPKLKAETVLSYVLLPQGLATFVYDDRGIFTHWAKGKPEEIQGKLNHFRNLCSDPNSNELELRQNARDLYDSLAAPIERYLSRERELIVELDPSMGAFPLDALLDVQNRFLVERGPIVYSLGAYYRQRSRPSETLNAQSSALVVTSPASSALMSGVLLPPLPDATAEGRFVAQNFRSARLLSAKEGTAKAVLSLLPNASIFHFAGHAINSSQHAGLLLSDSLLTASSLGQTSLSKLQLAVMSACATENGSSGGSYDADSLVRVFLRAGVPHVVASRWNVDSTSTQHFMTLFYRALLEGNSIPDSVHRAQIGLRSAPVMTHPFYWMAFTSFGTA